MPRRTDVAQLLAAYPRIYLACHRRHVAVDRLVRGGYVTRTVDAADRRRVQLRLSDAGVRIKRASSVLEPALVAAMLDRLTNSERADAIRGLALLAKAADALRASPSQ